MYVIGRDFDAPFGRAVLVDAGNGAEVATAVFDCPRAVIDQTMPDSRKRLLLEWTPQNTNDGS